MIAHSREQALAKRVNRPIPSEPNRHELPSLTVGDNVQIQNQHGNRPKRWYTTGVVTEALPNRQYMVVKDGSRRITLRNRKFLRKISPLCRAAPEVPVEDLPVKASVEPLTVADDDTLTTESPQPSLGGDPPVAVGIDPQLPDTPPIELRRGTRERIQREFLPQK